MVEARKKVNYYRLALKRGKMHRMSVSEDDRLVGEGGGVFYYLAPMFDSMDYQGTWHRLRLEGTFSNCKYEILAAATDADLEDILADDHLTGSERTALLKEHSWVRKVNTDDMLLHGIQGRYLWVMITVAGAKITSSFRIEGFQVEFPYGSFAEYLPEIYQQGRDTFFERYMTVLQSMYEDLEREVDKVPRYLDYKSTPEKNLSVFAEWTGKWNERGQWSPDQIRSLIGHLGEIQCGRGTRTVMEQMITFMTGKKAIVVEYFKWKDWMKEQSTLLKAYERLFGEDEDTFVVIIDGTEAEIGISKELLERRLEDYTPLGMHCRVVFLQKNSYMGTQCYMDKNGCLSIPEKPVAGGIVLGGDYSLE